MTVYHITSVKTETGVKLPNFYRVERDTPEEGAAVFAAFLQARFEKEFGSFVPEVHLHHRAADDYKWCDVEVTFQGDLAPLYTFRMLESDRPLHIRGANKRLVPETCKYCKFGKSIAGSNGLYTCRVPLPVWLKGTDRTVEPVAGGSCGTFTRR